MTDEMILTVQALRGGKPNHLWLERAADLIERLSAERDAAIAGQRIAGRLDVTDAEVIVAYDACGMSQLKAAERVFITPKAVGYRMRKITANTGKNPRERKHLDELLPVARTILGMDNNE